MTTTICFLDTEFTDLVNDPALLSLGMVTLAGDSEHYVELDLRTDIGQARKRACGEFARFGVLELWGVVPGAACTQWEMGRRTAEWLLSLAEAAGSSVAVHFDYSLDYEFMEYVVRDGGLWDRVREVVVPVYYSSNIDGDLAAEECFAQLRQRTPPLQRHHALADALALRAAYIAEKIDGPRLVSFAVTAGFKRLLIAAGGGLQGDPAAMALHDGQRHEAWLREWLLKPTFALDGRRGIDVVNEPGGIELVEGVLFRIAHNVGA